MFKDGTRLERVALMMDVKTSKKMKIMQENLSAEAKIEPDEVHTGEIKKETQKFRRMVDDHGP